MDGNLKRNLKQASIVPHLSASIKKEVDVSDDEEGRGNDCEANNQDGSLAFICEFCDYAQSKSFHSRDGLITHCLQCHPTVCLGCFELFASSEDLLQHLEAFPHEPPVCRSCCLSFVSAKAKSSHRCRTGSNIVQSSFLRKESTEASKKETMREGSSVVKTEPQDEARDSESKTTRDVYHKTRTDNETDVEDTENNDESDDDLEEKYDPKETSEDDSSDEESDYDYENDINDRMPFKIGASTDFFLSCMYCSFIARGSERYPSIRLLRNHTFSVHPTACSICFENFENEDELNEHLESMKHKTWGCVSCKIVYFRKSLYDRHQLKSHRDQCPLQCPKCPERFFIPKQLRRHEKLFHAAEGIDEYREIREFESQLPTNICTVCDYSTMTTFAVMMHMYEKHPEPNQIPKFKCDACQLGFSRPSNFGRHILEKHLEDPEFRKVYRQLVDDYYIRFECEACDKNFDCRNKYMMHLRVIHPSSLPCHCSICGSRYFDPADLQMHEARVHRNISPYVCDHCHKTFKNLSRLTNHFQRVHKMTTMPYLYCFLHNVGFCSNDNASSHFETKHKVRVKPAPETFKCEVCGRCLANKLSYTNHLTRHKSERSFKCEVCGKAYSNSTFLKNHETMHSDKHRCDICGKTFQMASFLKRHAVVHSGEKPFECTICGLKVSQKSALQRHMSKVHPGGIVGKPRSTKSRKCRTLSKAQAERKDDELAKPPDANATKAPLEDAPSPEPDVSKPLVERSPKPPVVQLDSWLLKTGVATKPQPIVPAGARAQKRQRKRQRKASFSEESSEDEDDSFCSPNTAPPAKVQPKAKGRPAKKRKRKSKRWGNIQSSSGEDDKSDDESDTPYVPNVRASQRLPSRRSSRLKA